jgi:hypothetical protein
VKLRSHGFPETEFADCTSQFIRRGLELENANWQQRLKIILGSLEGIVIGFIISFIAGLVSALLYQWLKR